VSTDTTQPNPSDAPAEFGARGYHHAWRMAARRDPRMTFRHLFVLDAFAEHYFPGKEAMRGVAVQDSRVAWYTGLGETSIREARADLIRWGWLVKIRRHGRGTAIARYAFVIPSLVPLVPRESRKSATRTDNGPAAESRESATRTDKAPENPQGGQIPPSLSPSPTYLGPKTAPKRKAPATSPADEAGRRSPQKTTPRPAARPGVGWDQVAAVLPGELATDGRAGRSAAILTQLVGAALLAGWSSDQLRAELQGADVGATAPVGVVVSRLKALGDRTAPTPKAAPVSPRCPDHREQPAWKCAECAAGHVAPGAAVKSRAAAARSQIRKPAAAAGA